MIARALRQLAEPSDRDDRVKCAINRASKLSGLSYWRCFDLWYRRGVIKPFERAQILDALARKQQAEARHELARLRTRLAALERQLEEHDADLDRETPDLFGLAHR